MVRIVGYASTVGTIRMQAYFNCRTVDSVVDVLIIIVEGLSSER